MVLLFAYFVRLLGWLLIGAFTVAVTVVGFVAVVIWVIIEDPVRRVYHRAVSPRQ